MNREVAWRVFASEFNDANIEIKQEGEKTPNYIITPLGAKINRLFIVGVLTDVENISESGELVRAHISDPSGVFTLFSGQFQQEVTNALSHIDVPAFVAVIGKFRTYSPNEDSMFVSIRPEKVVEVNPEIRDQWILETCKRTKERIEAITEARKMVQVNAFDLRKLGYCKDLSEGIVYSLKNYEDINVSKYLAIINESLQYLKPVRETLPYIATETELEPKFEEKDKKPKNKEKKSNTDDIKNDDFEKIENTVFNVIKDIENDDGASWDSITKKCEKAGIDRESIEEALNSLMDKGLIYEPVLSFIKTT